MMIFRDDCRGLQGAKQQSNSIISSDAMATVEV